MEPYHMWWGFGLMWIIPLLIIVGIVLLVAVLFRGSNSFWRGQRRSDMRETPREILDRRYASGEVTKEQYEEMKRTLER